jgi:hypothetical protein
MIDAPLAASGQHHSNAGRPRGRPFTKGNPDGPGRPKGSRNRAAMLLDAIAPADAAAALQEAATRPVTVLVLIHNPAPPPRRAATNAPEGGGA